MKILLTFFLATMAVLPAASQNPISPPGVYIADPSAHVWNDGRLYVYGSLDESCRYYCSVRHHVLVSGDLKSWKLHENGLVSKGPGDGISYNDNLLFAPDAAYKDGRYYLYYCQPDPMYTEGVANSVSPTGPFMNGQNIQLKGFNEIDPAVFIDDDSTAYYLWGQFSLKMARLNPDMVSLDTLSIQSEVLTESAHHFHEGASLTKRNGIYYLVFADISRGDVPTCIGYATATAPFGPYTYRGVIIDNNHCNPENWNNHGSIAEFNGQWYVFYHRSTHGCNIMRKACMEPINFNPDGSIPEVEMTSQGASGPLSAFSRLEAEWACILNGNVRIEAYEPEQECLTKIHSGDKAGFKYLDFKDGADSLCIRYMPGSAKGTVIVSAGKPWHRQLATVTIENGHSDQWITQSVKISPQTGVHALWLQFYGDEGDLLSLDWLEFR